MKTRALSLRGLIVTATAGLVALVAEPCAFAQVERESRTGADYTYEFEDDPLNSDLSGAFGYTIVARPGPIRVLLIRPRLHYVNEMLKSVEHM